MIVLSTLTGFFAGFVHVLFGPDHLAAVAPLSLKGRRRWVVGLNWGLGHSGGVIAVGALAVLARGVLPVEAMSAFAERMVGVALIGIGLWGFSKVVSARAHVHEHTHDGSTHEHMHIHGAPHDHDAGPAHSHTHAAFAVGTLHGLAGSSHVLGVLPALAMPSTLASALYLLFFGAGTIAAMAAFAAVIGAASEKMGGPRVYIRFMGACSVLAIATGAAWLVI